ncbi:MAG: DMT family transporter [Steroidobacteraceae bacterium]
MRTDSARGVAAMFICVAAFSCMDALLKLLSGHYPPLQVASLRGAASLPFVLLPLAWSGRLHELRPTRPWLHLLRAALGVIMLGTFVMALRSGSLGSVYAIYMAAPLLIVALAALLLGEHVDLGRWLAVLAGLAGVLVILQPSAGGVTLGSGLAAIVSALCYAFAAITARLLTRTDSSASMVFSFLAALAIVAGLLALPQWRPVAPQHGLLIAAVGLLGWLGQHFITEAFRHAPASTVAPIEYTALLWGIGIDRIFWKTSPALHVLAGAALVIGAGLYVAGRERRSR